MDKKDNFTLIKKFIFSCFGFFYYALLEWVKFFVLIAQGIKRKFKKLLEYADKIYQKYTIAFTVLCVFFIIGMIFVALPVILESSIKTFVEENDEVSKWMTFYSSYAGGLFGAIATIIAVKLTLKLTIDIQEENLKLQNKLLEIEEENKLNNSRTFIQEGIILCEFDLSNHRDLVLGSKLITTDNYLYMEDVLNKNGINYYNIKTDICNNLNNFVNINHFESTINDLNNFDKYIFRFLKNIGKNPMYNVKITSYGNLFWFENGRRISREDKIEYSIDYIDKGERIIIPMFRINRNLILEQLNAEKVEIEYYTGIMGLREKIIVRNEYNLNEEKITMTVDIEKITQKELQQSSKFLKFRYIN